MEKTMKYNNCDSFVIKTTESKCDIKPINSNIAFNPISVSILPPNVNWFDMEDFTSKKYGPFEFNFINANNNIIAGVSFYISYNSHGIFNSTGHYLADATVSPMAIFCNPGYYITCNVTASDPINYGTKTNPIAGVNLKIQMEVISYNKLILEENYHSLTNLISSDNLNAVEKYLIVNIRGDGVASVISGYSY
ncbi:hypothetical protein [Clostridium lundense]|uniref:hypothetical protein n=1 Tax=Clostridium lundense TaxID=319475 RepID=UPI0012EC170F|nr:hypothetical protein [Clostridium lundense]